MKLLREKKVSPQFTWKDYLKKLDEGKRDLTEKKLTEVNLQAYSLTMSTAVLLAIKTVAESDVILRDAFTFLSYTSHEAQSLEVVVKYVVHVDKKRDTEDVGMKIQQCSLIISSDDFKVVSILLHRIVHDCIKLYIAGTKINGRSRAPLIVLQLLLRHKSALGERALIPHLRAFYVATKNLRLTNLPSSVKVKIQLQKQIVGITAFLIPYGEFLLSKYFLVLAKTFAKIRRDEDKLDDKANLHISFPKIGEIYLNLGVVEMYLGKEGEARRLYKEALRIFLEQHGSSHVTVSTCLTNLGSLSCSNEQECRESKMFSERALGTSNNPDDLGIYYTNEGKRYNDRGYLLKAKENFELTQAAFGKTLDGIKTSQQEMEVISRLTMIWLNLGAIDHRLGMYEDAKRKFKLSIKWLQNSAGPNHLELGNAYYNLGLAHLELNEKQDAEQYFRRALETYSQQLEPSDKRLAMVSHELSNLLKRTGRFREAADLDKKYGTFT